MNTLPPKSTAEIVPIQFDFTAELGAETVITQLVTASLLSGYDSTPANVLSGSATNVSGVITQTITGGIAGNVYKLTAKITTSGNRTLVLVAYLPVV